MSERTNIKPVDFAAVWHGMVREDKNNRVHAGKDLAFWERYAAHYDVQTATPGTYTETLKLLTELVRPDDSLLDVGAGTGRFALPLAGRVRHVTALDHSAAMLAILRQKMGRATLNDDMGNIAIVEAAWEEVQVERHDVVLAAWSLYRQPDILAALRKLVATTRRLLLIVDGDITIPPHEELMASIWGAKEPSGVPKYLYFLGALWQIGIRADVRIVHETRSYYGSSPQAIAQQLAPSHATPAEIERFTSALLPRLRRQEHGCSYAFPFTVGVLIWHRRVSNP